MAPGLTFPKNVYKSKSCCLCGYLKQLCLRCFPTALGNKTPNPVFVPKQLFIVYTPRTFLRCLVGSNGGQWP